MSRGRPPTPTSRLKQQGTYRKDRHGGREELGPQDLPTRPRGLTGDARKFWDEHVPRLAGFVCQTDAPYLIGLCRWWALWRQADKRLSEIVSGKVEGNSYSATVQAGMCWNNFAKAASRFGLSPADRMRLMSGGDGDAEVDEFLEFLKGSDN